MSLGGPRGPGDGPGHGVGSGPVSPWLPPSPAPTPAQRPAKTPDFPGDAEGLNPGTHSREAPQAGPDSHLHCGGRRGPHPPAPLPAQPLPSSWRPCPSLPFFYIYVILFILAALGLRFSSWGDGAALQGTDSVAVEPGLSCPEEYRIFPDQGSNSCLLCWQAEPSPLSHQGSPRGLGPSDEPPTPSQPLAVICATPLRCSHPPDGHMGEA